MSEMVANALDSGAATVSLAADPAAATLTVVDNGAGMSRRELARYHDLAASTKTRGRTIGFAGVGIKLGLLACEEVFTETRRGRSHIATTWRLASRHRAPWQWAPPAGLVSERGTAVRLKLANPLSPLLDHTFVAAVVARHYEPLLDSAFTAALAARYPRGVQLILNGRALGPRPLAAEPAPLAVRVGRQRKPSAYGYLARSLELLPADRRGLAVSTLGKVIQRGWDWLGLVPGRPEHVTGVVEVPALAAALTLNKGDFIRVGRRGALYLAYRKALQEVVAAQLTIWGDAAASGEQSAPRRSRALERDLQTVLAELADDFPLLAPLVDWRRGGQGRIRFARGTEPGGAGLGVVAVGPVAAEAPSGPTELPVPSRGTAAESGAPSERSAASGGSALPGPVGPKRAAHSGLLIRFESRPDDPALGRLVESTLWINDAHAACRRAAAARAEEYHVALTVGLTLAPLAVEPTKVHEFVTAFLARWGETNGHPRRRRSR